MAGEPSQNNNRLRGQLAAYAKMRVPSITEAELSELLDSVEFRTYRRGDMFNEPGQPETFGIVLSGAVRVYAD